MNSPTGEWGLFQWFTEHGQDHIHPDDRAKIAAQHPVGLVFECQGTEDGYIILYCHDNALSFRARPSLFVSLPAPSVRVGDRVGVVSGDSSKIAQIHNMGWHHQRKEYMYFLTIDGKRATKRYWIADFIQ